MSRVVHLKGAALKAAVVLVPSYSAAWLTDKMVWVVPTMAAASFFAATLEVTDTPIRRRVDEDESDAPDELDGGGTV
ncbi:MAG: hypothetical protein ACRBBT_02025 [Paracoccaceae bacterium]